MATPSHSLLLALLLLTACSSGEPSSSDDPGDGGGGGGGGADAAIFTDAGTYQTAYANSGEVGTTIFGSQFGNAADNLQYWNASPRGMAQRIVDLHGGQALIDPVNSSPSAPSLSCALTYTGLDSVLQPIDANENGYYDNVAVIFPANCRRTPGGGYVTRATGTIRFKELSGNAGYVVLIDLPTYTTDSTHHTGALWVRDTVRLRGDSIQWSRAVREDYFPTTPENGRSHRTIYSYTGVYSGGQLPGQTINFSPGIIHRGSAQRRSRYLDGAEPGVHTLERILAPFTYGPCNGGIPVLTAGYSRVTLFADTTKGAYVQIQSPPDCSHVVTPFGFDPPPT